MDSDKMKSMVDNMIKVGDFSFINNDSLEEYKLFEDTRVYVVGHQLLPVDENDIYNQRVAFIVSPLDEGGHIQEGNILVVDPSNMTRVDDEEQEKLSEIFQEDYKEKDETAH